MKMNRFILKKKIRWMKKCSECHNHIYSVGNTYTPIRPPPPMPNVNKTEPKKVKAVYRPSIKDLLNIKNKLKKISKK